MNESFVSAIPPFGQLILIMVGLVGFEPTKAEAADLQSAGIDH